MTSRQAAELKELEQCTFKPKTNRPKSALDISKSHSRNTSFLSKSATSTLPRNFEKSIERIRKVREGKWIEEKKYAAALRGERFDKVKLGQVQPPSFSAVAKRKLLLYVNVNITP